MVQKTSWEGVITKRLRKQGRLKGAYTRYQNRRTKQGIQIVKNKPDWNEVYILSGNKLIPVKLEFHYENVYGNDPKTLRRNNKKKEKLRVFLKKHPEWRNKVILRR